MALKLKETLPMNIRLMRFLFLEFLSKLYKIRRILYSITALFLEFEKRRY